MLVMKREGIPSKVKVLACLCEYSDASAFDHLDQACKMDGNALRKYFHFYIYNI